MVRDELYWGLIILTVMITAEALVTVACTINLTLFLVDVMHLVACAV